MSNQTKICELCGADYDRKDVRVFGRFYGEVNWVDKIATQAGYIPSLCENCLRAVIYGVSLNDKTILLANETRGISNAE